MSVTSSSQVAAAKLTELEDQPLLLRFAKDNDQAAFAELVRRYVNFVYRTATRALGRQKDLADDVTQAVFIILSKKASGIRSGQMLPHWLHQTTLYTVFNARKVQFRRERHEQSAARERQEASMTHSSEDKVFLHRLDEAIASLSKNDQSVIIAHYLAGLPMEDLAKQMGSSPAAVQKRLQRAVEKLRSFFKSKGTELTTVALTTIMNEECTYGTPDGLTLDIVSTTFNASSETPQAGIFAQGTLTMMAISQLKLVSVIAAGILVLGAVGILAADQMQTAAPTAAPSTAPAPEKAQDDHAAIQGRWLATGGYNRGRVVPAERIARQSYVITGDLLLGFDAAEARERYQYVLDPAKTPKQIKLSDPAGNREIVAIYELSGDTFRLCVDERNPANPPEKFPEDPTASTLTIADYKRASR